MASKDNTFRSEASSRTVPELLSELTETWKKREEDLLQKATDLKYKLKKKNEDFEVLTHSDLRNKEELNFLRKKIEGLEDELKRKVNEIGKMKMVNDQSTKKISVYRNIYLDLYGKVLDLEKSGNELRGSGCSSGVLEVKKHGAESSRLHPPPGFEEIVPKPKNITESKALEIIVIDDDDDVHDLINIGSSKRKRVSGWRL